jgi:hypothetical protein
MRISRCPPSGEHGYECSAELVREPENPHDPYAIKVESTGSTSGTCHEEPPNASTSASGY